jgi:prepilin-type N-terminal cleavage/methylation domain-containing protein
MLSKSKNPRGFTLVELMIAVSIISILAAISIPNVMTFKDKAIQKAAMVNLEVVRTALSQYSADQDDNHYPTTAMIGDFTTLCHILDDYGLTFDFNDGVDILKWKNFVGYAGTGTNFTVTIIANDSSSTTFRATLSGIR